MATLNKPRLRRLDWLYTDRPVYFLTACLEDRRALLANPQVHEAFIRFAQEASKRNVLVGRYVLISDHVHLFAAFSPLAPRLPAWMKALKGCLAEVLRNGQGQGPYWQKGFFDHVLRSEESYHQKWLYVRENPVRAGLVNKPDGWPYQGEISILKVPRKL